MWLYSEIWSGVVAIRRDLVAWVTVVVRRDLIARVWLYGETLSPEVWLYGETLSPEVWLYGETLPPEVWLYGETATLCVRGPDADRITQLSRAACCASVGC